jgi:hypothetical protein
MLAQTVKQRNGITAVRDKAFRLATSMMLAKPESQPEFTKFIKTVLISMTHTTVGQHAVYLHTARILARQAYKGYRRQQRGGVGQHLRH